MKLVRNGMKWRAPLSLANSVPDACHFGKVWAPSTTPPRPLCTSIRHDILIFLHSALALSIHLLHGLTILLFFPLIKKNWLARFFIQIYHEALMPRVGIWRSFSSLLWTKLLTKCSSNVVAGAGRRESNGQGLRLGFGCQRPDLGEMFHLNASKMRLPNQTNFVLEIGEHSHMCLWRCFCLALGQNDSVIAISF